MSTDEQWLRATLAVEAVPPPDLADRAERTAHRLRRRRVAAAAAAAAVLVAVPLAVQGARGPDRTAGPAPTASPSPPADCNGIGLGSREDAPRPARSAAEADWPYRGDAGLRDAAVAAGAGLAQVRPLFGGRLDGGGTVVMAAGRRGAAWRLRYAVTGAGTGTADGSAEQALPALGPATQLSLVLQRGPGGVDIPRTLVVVAPPGTSSITYRWVCGSEPRSRSAPGSTAVLPLRTDAELSEGVVEAVGPTGTVELGEPGTNYAGGPSADPLPPIPVPAGYRALDGVVVDGPDVFYRGRQPVMEGQVLVRCWSPGQWGGISGSGYLSARCDGLVHLVSDQISFSPGLQIGIRSEREQVRVLVVVPDR